MTPIIVALIIIIGLPVISTLLFAAYLFYQERKVAKELKEDGSTYD